MLHVHYHLNLSLYHLSFIIMVSYISCHTSFIIYQLHIHYHLSLIIYAVVAASALLSCDIHTHTPARKVLQTSSCTILLYKIVLQTGLGMGMGINGTAQLHYIMLHVLQVYQVWDMIVCLSILGHCTKFNIIVY